jgi:peroxiredoxin-like protein
MSGKTGKHLFQVQLNWLTEQKGLISSKEALGTLHVATPPVFGGEGKPWTPEHFFLGAISSCFMTTFLAFSKKLQFEFIDLECEAIGQIEIVEGKYKFTQVDLYPKVYLENEEHREKAAIALEKAHKYCLVSNSINAVIFYHSEIIIKDVPDPAEHPVNGDTELARALV